MKREFRNDGQHYNITHLYRYKKLFQNEELAQNFIDTYFKDIPFLNGGLFECLDVNSDTEKTEHGNPKVLRFDGFSDRDDNSLEISNDLFFGNTPSFQDTPLSEGNQTKGLFEILKSLSIYT